MFFDVNLPESGGDLLDVAVIELAQDAERFGPGAPGRGEGTAAVMGVAEVDQGRGHVVPVAQGAIQRDGLPVGLLGRAVLAELVVGPADAVPGGCLAVQVAGRCPGQCLAAVLESGPMVAEQGMAPTDPVEAGDRPAWVSGGPVQL